MYRNGVNSDTQTRGAGERRQSRRQRTLKGAKAVFNGTSAITCAVRNLSDRGAMLLFDSIGGIPSVFTLIFDDGSAPRQCVIEHRHPSALGVAFLAPSDQ